MNLTDGQIVLVVFISIVTFLIGRYTAKEEQVKEKKK